MAGNGGRSHHSTPEPSGTTSSHEFSGNTTCILYCKAFQGFWLKTIQQWGMPSFCCWNKLRLLNKWPFVLMSVMWTDSHPTLMELHSYWHWLWGVFLPVETAGGGHCDFLVCAFPLFLHLSFNPHLLQSVWCHVSHHLNRNSRLACSLSRATDDSL